MEVSMKTRITISFIFLTVFFGALTQSVWADGPVITRSCVPQIGQVIGHQNARSSGIVIGAAGANKVWDYSTLTDSGSVYTEQYLDASSTPYHNLFSDANVAVRSEQGAITYTYFFLSNSKLEAFGTASSSDTDLMTNTRIVTTFPRAYQSSVVDNYAGRVTGESNIIYSARDSSYVDGFGTLKLPHNIVYTDVARVASVAQYTMAELSDTTKKYTVTMLRYSHFSPNFNGGSLLTIGGVSLGGFGTRYTSADYVSNVGSDVPIADFGYNLTMMPNPAQDIVTVAGSEPTDYIERVDLYSQTGELIMSMDAHSNSFLRFDISSLPSNVYFLRVRMNSQMWQSVLCVVH